MKDSLETHTNIQCSEPSNIFSSLQSGGTDKYMHSSERSHKSHEVLFAFLLYKVQYHTSAPSFILCIHVVIFSSNNRVIVQLISNQVLLTKVFSYLSSCKQNARYVIVNCKTTEKRHCMPIAMSIRMNYKLRMCVLECLQTTYVLLSVAEKQKKREVK